MYYFDKLEYIQRILRNPKMTAKMYFGLQRLSDVEQNLWDSRIWGESILSTSGQCVRPRQFGDDSPLLPGDSVIYAQLDPDSTATSFSAAKFAKYAWMYAVNLQRKINL